MALAGMPTKCGIPTTGEDIARRGGLGYLYSVLKKYLLNRFRVLSRRDMNEMVKYMRLQEDVNSYDLLGFSDVPNKIRNQVTAYLLLAIIGKQRNIYKNFKNLS